MNNEEIDPNSIYPSFSLNDWNRLRDTLSAIKAAQQTVSENNERFNEFISEDKDQRNYAAQIQSKQIRLRIYEEKIKIARNRVKNLRYQLNLAIEENEKQETQLNTHRVELETSGEEIKRLRNESSELKLSLLKLGNELAYRRRWMLLELYKIYFIDDQFYRIFKRQCNCDKFDLIRGLHLPKSVARLGHREEELCAAVGHTVNLLCVMCRILCHPLRYPVYFQGSKSHIYDRFANEIFQLYTPNTRSQRPRFDQALSYLNKNIVQLRSDCGLETRDLDRAVENLKELIMVLVGRTQIPLAANRPYRNLFSPATVIPQLVTEEKNPLEEINEKLYKQLMLTDTESSQIIGEDSIIGVISSKYDNFSILNGKKLSKEEEKNLNSIIE